MTETQSTSEGWAFASGLWEFAYRVAVVAVLVWIGLSARRINGHLQGTMPVFVGNPVNVLVRNGEPIDVTPTNIASMPLWVQEVSPLLGGG